MRKYNKTNKALVLMCVSLFLVIALGVLSLCFLSTADMSSWEINKLSYIFAGGAVLFLVVYLATLCFVAKVKKEGKAHVELSFEIVIAATLLIALSPLALVLWAIYGIGDAVHDSRLKKAQKSLK